jgi:hypothetical protein
MHSCLWGRGAFQLDLLGVYLAVSAVSLMEIVEVSAVFIALVLRNIVFLSEISD